MNKDFSCTSFRVSCAVLPCLVICAFVLMLGGCKGKDADRLGDFAKEWATAVNSGDTAAVFRMYPAAAKADSLTAALSTDSLKVTIDDTQSSATLTFGPGVDMVVSGLPDGPFEVKSSHGLFAYAPEVMAFAKKTGQWKDGLTDAEQAVRMADRGFADFLLADFNNKVKGGLKIAQTSTYGDDYYEGEWVSADGVVFKVSNSSPYDVPGSAWSILYKEGYWGGGNMGSEVVPGKDVKAGGTVEVRTSELGSSMESETGQQLVFKPLSKEEMMRVFVPKGTEYEEYVKSGGKPEAVAERLQFLLEGPMGGWSTRLSMDGKDGSLIYKTGGDWDGGGSVEQRKVTLVSYDPATSQLVLRVERYYDGVVTGNLVGTYRGGRYQGQFKNVNGKASAFSFK